MRQRNAENGSLPLCLLPPVFLDYYIMSPRGYDMGRLPSETRKIPVCWGTRRDRMQRVWLRILRAASKLIVLQFTEGTSRKCC